MYKELATIKDGDLITGFLMYDGTKTLIMDIETAKIEAAAGNIDTLGYENDQFIPIVQGEIAEELKEKGILENYENACKTMTFEDFVRYDAQFQKDDVDLMMSRDDAALANIGTVLETDVPGTGKHVLMLTMVFWSRDGKNNASDLMAIRLSASAIGTVHSYGNFVMVNIPAVKTDRIDLDLAAIQKTIGAHVLYNLDVIRDARERTMFSTNAVPEGLRRTMGQALPTEDTINQLVAIAEAANKASMAVLNP